MDEETKTKSINKIQRFLMVFSLVFVIWYIVAALSVAGIAFLWDIDFWSLPFWSRTLGFTLICFPGAVVYRGIEVLENLKLDQKFLSSSPQDDELNQYP